MGETLLAPMPGLSNVLGRRRLLSLTAVLGALAGAAAVGHRELLAADAPASDLLRGESLVGFFRTITVVGATETAIAAAAVLGLIVWRRCRTLAVVYPATLVTGAIAAIGLKALVGRPRPPSPDTRVALASFPSGHTLQTTLLLGMLPFVVWVFTERRWAFRVTGALSGCGILAVGVSRVYLGAHWPTDVVGAVIIGAVVILGAERLLIHPRFHAGCHCPLSAA